MSWNEPGRDRDPWDGGSGGPSDLDQMFRRLRERLARLLHGRPGPARPRRVRIWWFVPVLVVAIWLIFGFFRVPSGSRAVRLQFGAYAGTAGPGAHWEWPWPIGAVHVVDVGERRSVGQRGTVLTSDGKLAVVELTVSYRVSDPYRYLFGSVHAAAVLGALAADALNAAASGHTLAELSGQQQGAIEQALETRVAGEAKRLDTGVDVDAVQISGISLPASVAEAHKSLAASRAKARAAVSAARAAAAKSVAEARLSAHRQVAEAQDAAAEDVASARSEAVRFEALLPAFRAAPEATREMLRRSALRAILAAAPKVVVVGPVRSVEIPGWPPAKAASAPAPATAAKPPAAASVKKGA